MLTLSKKKVLVWALILIFLTASGTYVATNSIAVTAGDKVVVSKSDFDTLQQVKKLLGLKEYIKDYYVEGADDSKLMEGAMKGMFESLGDPYSVYMTKEEYKSFNEMVSGSYAGVGLVITRGEDGYITVVSPIEDTPGAKAGILTNDKIVKIDAKDAIGLDLDAAVALMKGKPGTKVQLTIARDKVKEPLVFNITRQEIQVKSVKGKVMENNLGYIRISSFDENTGAEFKKVLNELKGKKIKGLVLDLRQNPGGYVSQCIEVANSLLDKGLVVYTEDKNKKRESYYSDEGKLEVPFVVLVDGGSASASEILAGAIKDRKVAPLIGLKTFGKGLVQTPEELKDGSGFKLTTQKYYTPNGTSINKIGIQPDIEVKPLEIKENQRPEAVKDVQLDKAVEVLKGKIK